MDIFEDTCDHDSVENLELERFKVKIREIWNRLLEECYAKYPTEGMDLEHFKEHNALHFADEPQPEDETINQHGPSVVMIEGHCTRSIEIDHRQTNDPQEISRMNGNNSARDIPQFTDPLPRKSHYKN